jgi:preprotein translocase subunit SecE
MAKPEEKKQSFAFFRNIIADLKKVTWPTPREAIYLTGIVLLVSIVIGLVLGGLDWVLAWVVNNTLLG